MANSFFDKIKKGMNDEETKPQEIEEIPINLKTEEDVEEEKKEEKKKKKKEKPKKEELKTFSETEGQLAVDIYQTENDLIVQSAIAGVKPENIDIMVDGDLLSIKGERKRESEENEDYFSQECYWGPFSRKIIFPVEVDPGRIDAILKEGILTIRIPKISREKKRKITIKNL